jgi:hypothetical protein
VRRAIIIVILSGLVLSALSFSALAQSQSTFYLHANYLLDQNAPTGTTANALKLSTEDYYVWKTALFSAESSFPAATWTAAVWMNTTQGATQYRLRLGSVSGSGVFAEYAHAFTPIVTSASPARYEVSISVRAFTMSAGESLAIGFLRHWENESYSPVACIFFDSQSMPSSIIGASATTTTVSTTTQVTTTQTTTQLTTTTTAIVSSSGIGWAFALIGVGIAVAAAGGGVAAALRGQPYPKVFAYGGHYYCGKHRVPLYSVGGWLWCPQHRQYLSRTCRSCGNAVKQTDRFCDRCGRAIY